MGGGEQIKEAVRDQRGLLFLESLMTDVRFGLRMLRKNPGFTATAMVTLALGIGANTAIFSVVDAALFRALPFSNPEKLVQVWVKTQIEPLSVVPAVREGIAALDNSIALARVRTMEQVVGQSIQNTTTEATLLGAFSGLGLALAAIGVYGVMAYLVAQRTHEIGVRVALGAQKHDVLRLVMVRGAGLTLIGLVVGTGGALALTRVMASVLYGVTPTDPFTFAASACFLLTIAAIACWIPARRAMRVDPVSAMRCE